jgi:hypothetical protein
VLMAQAKIQRLKATSRNEFDVIAQLGGGWQKPEKR